MFIYNHDPTVMSNAATSQKVCRTAERGLRSQDETLKGFPQNLNLLLLNKSPSIWINVISLQL